MDHHADAGVQGHAVAPSAEQEGDHARGLLLIGLFKFSKAIFFSAVGAGALDLVHKNLGDMLMHVIAALHMDPEGHFVGILMDRADLIGHHQLRQGAIFSFSYAALCVVEGTGLTLRKVWAEYFTVILTAGALPWESYELVVHYSSYKIAFLAANLVVLFYLLWVLKRKRAVDTGC